MGHQCCSKQKVKRGLWSPEEDEKLVKYITTHGHGCWSSIPRQAGLQRCGKSCRLRWINYLRPDLKRGSFTEHEERIIVDVHRILGNRWAQIAKHLPGRTDNEVKNFWNSCIKKKLIAQGLDPKTHNLIPNTRPPACANSASNIYHFQPNACTPFTINSIKEPSDLMSKMTPLQNPSMHDAMEISTFQYPDHTAMMMSFDDGSSLARPNISQPFVQADFMDDHCCIWDSDPLEALGDESKRGGGRKEQQGAAESMVMMNAVEEDEVGMESCYGNAAGFDLDLMGTELMPCESSVFGSGSSMEQLQWEC